MDGNKNTSETAGQENTGRLITQKDLLDVMEAVMKEQSGVYQRLNEMDARISSLESDRDQVVNRHIERRLLNGSGKDPCGMGGECSEPALSRMVRRLRNG